MFNALEKKINLLIKQIESKKITPAESGIGKWLNQLKAIDEPLYEKLNKKYIEVFKGLGK